MNAKQSTLTKAVRSALMLTVAVAAGTAGVAYGQSAVQPAETQDSGAQQQKTATLQTIEVTGSHIRAAQLATAMPLTIVTSRQIAATGSLTLGSVLQRLPQITGAIHNADQDYSGNSGATFIGLRGLGASRTLVLIDGQRIAGPSSNNANGAVDLNAIPAAAVERVEVLSSGASAIYGTDAIGGVINIILKSNYQGAQVSTNFGISSRGDGQSRGGTFIYGHTSDKGNILAGVSYNKFDAVSGTARSFSRGSDILTTTAGGQRTVVPSTAGPGPGPYLSLAVSPTLAQKFGCDDPSAGLALKRSAWSAGTSPTTPADYKCSGFEDNLDTNAILLLVTPQERVNAFFRGTFDLSKNITAYLTVLHDRTDSNAVNEVPPYDTGLTPGVTLSKDSYYNPFGVDFSQDSGNLLGAELYPEGLSKDLGSTSYNYALAGVRGHLDLLGHGWDWDVGMNYSHIHESLVETDLPNYGPLTAGAGPSFMNSSGEVQCGTPSDPIALSTCTPWDPLNNNSPSSRAVVSENMVQALNLNTALERDYHADANGELFNLPGGEAQLAVGVAYRKMFQSRVNDPALLLDTATGTCSVGGSCTGPGYKGGFNVKEAYGELYLPLVNNEPFAHALSVTLGARHSNYSNFGTTNNYKLGIQYRPVQDLLLRGTISSVFRAPTLRNLYDTPSEGGGIITSDPCDFIAPSPTAQNPMAGSPACVNVPKSGTFVDPNVLSRGGSINAIGEGSTYAGVNLGPEIGKSFDFGAVYSPPFAKHLDLSADVWRIYLNNIISSASPQTELHLCASGDLFYCSFIHRLPNGPQAGAVQVVESPAINLGRLDVKGVDFTAAYRFETTSAGQFDFSVGGTYLTQFKAQTAPGTSENIVSNGAGLMAVGGTSIEAACPGGGAAAGLCYFPRLNAQGVAAWQLGPWSAQWTFRYLGRFRIAEDPQNEVGIDRYGATVYNDVTASYSIRALNMVVAIGANNVFDKQPPLLFANRSEEFSTDTTAFDVLGRYYWGRITVSFK